MVDSMSLAEHADTKAATALKTDSDGSLGLSKKQMIAFLKDDSDRCIIGIIEVPIVACYRIGPEHVAFFCPNCQKLHPFAWGRGNPNGYNAACCDKFSNGLFLSHQESLMEVAV